jgi:sterol desaturase/sphingolipid hydroxylase (fatty acid hydroxylase superfamily)
MATAVQNLVRYSAEMSTPLIHALNGSASRLSMINEPTDDALIAEMPFWQRAFSLENDGMVMALATLAVTLLLELISLGPVRKLCKTKGGRQLYAWGVLYNFLNNGILGPPTYEFVCTYCSSQPLSAAGRVMMTAGIIGGHSVGYYCAHRWMHTRPMYWAHKFHHQFNVVVVPVSANAVSLAEYIIAYMLPFVAGCAILRPDRFSVFVAVSIISFNSLLIHTPSLADASAKAVPWLFVSTADHLEHHRRLTKHYAAPTVSVDRVLASIVGKPASWNKNFDAAEQVEGADKKDR